MTITSVFRGKLDWEAEMFGRTGGQIADDHCGKGCLRLTLMQGLEGLLGVGEAV